MIPANTLTDLIAGLLAADAASIGNPVSNKLGLIVAPFNPSVDLLMADLTIAAETGLVAIAGVAGSQLESVDPSTGELIVEVKVPAGGFRWETPIGFTGPVTIYGLALGNNAMTILYGTQLLDNPIILTDENEAYTAPIIQFRIDPNKIH